MTKKIFFFFAAALLIGHSSSALAQAKVRPSSVEEKVAFMRAKGVYESAVGFAYMIPSDGTINAAYLNQVFDATFVACLANGQDVSNFQSLTQTEIVSVCLYTLHFYQLVALQINAALKTGEPLGLAITTLDSALAKMPNYKKAEVTHAQNIDLSRLKSFFPGRRVRVPHYLSSSKGEGMFTGNLKLIIKPLYGKDIQKISSIPQEEEVLFPRNSVFVSKKISRGRSPYDARDIVYTVWLEQVAK